MIISIAGVFLGTTVLLMTLSVMNGFETEVKNRIMGSFAHVKVQSFKREAIGTPDSLIAEVLKIPGVVAAAPLIEDKAAISSRDIRDGVMIKGVDIVAEEKVTDLSKNIKEGELNLGVAISRKERSNPGIILGSYVADKLRVIVGDEVIVMSLRAEEDAVVGMQPKMKRLTVTALYESGMYEYDANLAFTSLETAADLFGVTGAMALEVRVKNPEHANLVAEDIRGTLGYPWDAVDWMRQYGTLIKWMNTEKLIAFIVISMIIMVAIFNIISSLLMVVMEKTGEIGILLSMGATPKHITRIFIFNGLFVGIIGTVTGLIVGLSVCFAQMKFAFIHLPPDVYFLDKLPMLVVWTDVLAVVLITNGLCLLFSLYPARKASKLKPVDALKYI
jgi:lipoprotein-releasing system permease protein